MSVPAPTPVRARPRDRKARIAEAAAAAFAARGYHRVSMNDVAQAVGISAPALYRHFPHKYALFAQAAFATAHRLLVATETVAVEEARDRDAAFATVDALLEAVIATTIELRAIGGIYRWEGHYLEREDRARLTAEFGTLRERVAGPHAVYRPDLDADERELLVWAALSAIASITAHRTVLAASSLQEVLRAAAWRVLDADVPAVAPAVPRAPSGDVSGRRRDRLIVEAIDLFAVRGYHDVTIEDIASAVDLTPSGVYRHFDGKSSILLEACVRAAARLEDSAARARSADPALPPGDALRALARDYVGYSIDNENLLRVYFAEARSLGDDEQRRLRSLQQHYIATWVEVLREARPDLPLREATVLVHAGFGVVGDLRVYAHRRRVDLAEATVTLLMVVLGVD